MWRIGSWIIGRETKTEQPVQKTVNMNTVLGSLVDVPSVLSNEKTISKKLLEANKEWVYRNNDVIAKEVGAMEFELYSVGLKQGEIVYNQVVQHEILDLLDRFNDTTTKADALYNTESHKNLAGDAFWLLVTNGRAIRSMFLLQPDKVELNIADPTDATDTLVESYTYKDVIDGKSIEKTYRAEDVIHFKHPNPRNMFRGLGKVEAAQDTIDLDNLSIETTRKYFLQGAITNFVLSTEARITEDQLKRIKAELKNAHGGVSNAYKTMILGGGLKPEKLSFSNKEMEMLGSLEWYRDKLMVIFGNTKASLGIIDDVNRASHESSIISWKRNTVKPDMKAICDTLNEFLTPRFGKNLVLGFCDPVPEDRTSKLEEVTKAKEVTTINERRELLGYDPVEGGDVIPEVESNRRADEMAKQPVQVPKSLRNINLKAVLRRNGIYKQKEMYAEAKKLALPLAKKLLAKKKDATREHPSFTNDKVWGYWRKQIGIVEVVEQRFKNAVEQFIDAVEKQVILNLEDEVARHKIVEKRLLQQEDLVKQAEVDLTPLLMEVAFASGQQAMLLIGIDDPYMAFALRDAVKANVHKFTESMLDTDRDKLIDIITDGVKDGKSVANIRRDIEDAFISIRKVQAERITRTEVIKVSNMAAADAWEQSGVVESKQWLTAEDDRVEPICAAMNGKTIELRGKFFKKGEEFMGMTFDYSSIKEPPLHPNCRCVLLPVVTNQKSFIPAPILEKTILDKRVKELEAKVDKRSKAYREIKSLRSDDMAYIKSLEKLLGANDE